MSKRITHLTLAVLRKSLLLTTLGMAFGTTALAVGPISENKVPTVIVDTSKEPIAKGKYEPTWDSLKQYGSAPEWFRDAKFGIWSHWGPQCQPESGDWYAREMYYQGSGANKVQVAKYGHPSKFGFKDVVNEWKAEKWDPEKLVTFYKTVGAQYFFAMGNHHDNVDMWDSKYQPWNTVKIGPQKDILDGFAKAAKKNGLPFGVSFHAAHAWSWLEGSQGADKTGPLAGVPYDGKLTKADGKGLWWDGLDPQDLYAQNHTPNKDANNISGVHSHWEWQNLASLPDQAYCDKFYNRCMDAINKYKPDLVYFDDSVMPLWPVSDMALKFTAHFYNANASWHNGKNEAVVFGKELKGSQTKAITCDYERRVFPNIMPEPWQTCDCLGDWHYNRGRFTGNSYRKSKDVIQELIDIVSKNGNLLLNVPVRGDGTIDDKEMKILDEIKAWLDVNKEGLFSTRPWKQFGETIPPPDAMPTPADAKPTTKAKPKAFSASDVRFTTSKDAKTIYAIVMGWPSDGFQLKSITKDQGISKIALLGSKDEVKWSQDDNGLKINAVQDKPATADTASVYKITLK